MNKNNFELKLNEAEIAMRPNAGTVFTNNSIAIENAELVPFIETWLKDKLFEVFLLLNKLFIYIGGIKALTECGW